MSLHKKLKAHFSAVKNGAAKAQETVPDERPHFVRDYTRFIAALKEQHPIDDAMSLAVGGNYEYIGQIERAILQHYGLCDGTVMLDMGRGSGRLSTALSDLDIDYTGIDILPDLLDYARSRSRKSFKFVLHAELSVPLPDSSLHTACAFSLFTHLHHDESYLYLQDAFRALKPGGTMIFSFLEFAADYHWPVFADTAANKKAGVPQHLNQFIERNAISLWAKHIGYDVWEFVDGIAHPWGERALGQSVAVLRKPA